MAAPRTALFLLILFLASSVTAQEANDQFFAAARKGDVATVKAMLDKGVDVNLKTRYGATALSYACDKGHLDLAKLLIDRGADVNVKDTFYGEVPIGWALSRGHAEIVKLLLDHGASGIDRVLAEGVQTGNAEIVKTAIDKGGLKPETLNNALRRAIKSDNKDIIELLKKAGATAVEVTIQPDVLNSYAGVYKNEQIGELTIEDRDGKLSAKLGPQNLFTTSALSNTSFLAIEMDATITFNKEGDKVTGLTLSQPGRTFIFKKLEQK
jgi:ankyrin repeat protein